jgi:hypothetical protein
MIRTVIDARKGHCPHLDVFNGLFIRPASTQISFTTAVTGAATLKVKGTYGTGAFNATRK